MVLLLAGVTVAMASHATMAIDVPTLKADNTPAGPNEAYSPKQTCGGCHFNCTTLAYTGDSAAEKATWCGAPDRDRKKTAEQRATVLTMNH